MKHHILFFCFLLFIPNGALNLSHQLAQTSKQMTNNKLSMKYCGIVRQLTLVDAQENNKK